MKIEAIWAVLLEMSVFVFGPSGWLWKPELGSGFVSVGGRKKSGGRSMACAGGRGDSFLGCKWSWRIFGVVLGGGLKCGGVLVVFEIGFFFNFVSHEGIEILVYI